MSEDSIEHRIQAALERDPAINLRHYPIQVHQDCALRLEGTVADIEAKRHAIQIAHQVTNNAGVDDRLRLEVARQRPDDELRQAVVQRLIQEPEFIELQLVEGNVTPHPNETWVRVSVRAGVVLLEGITGSLTHRRLMDVLCWWTPGVADVHNHLHVQPPEWDSDDELAEAVRMVLGKEPAIDSARIQIKVQERAVTLRGSVHSKANRRIAAWDCWYIPGVHGVHNQLEVAE